MVTHDEREAAEAMELKVNQNRRPFKHPWFCDWVRGCDGAPGDRRTSLEPRIQSAADQILAAKSSADETYAVVVLSVRDSSVLAMTASGDYFARDAGQLNAASGQLLTDVLRQEEQLLVVAGQQNHADSHIFQFTDRPDAFLLQRVRHSDDSQKPASLRKK